jgi:cytochrome c553
MTKVLVSLLAALAVSAQAWAAAPPDTLAQRMQACVACHGKEGRATSAGFFPRIAGKPAGYLYNQLVNFRDGRRRNAAMAHLLQPLSDAYLREIAEYFSALELPYPAAQTSGASDSALARGEQLVRRGDAARGIPACAQCHGSGMTGIAPAVPGLLGLPRDYLLGQLGAWRSGERRAVAPDCMAQVARRLSAEDVAAMALWLSSQPVRGGPAPAARLPTPLPLACGSVAR